MASMLKLYSYWRSSSSYRVRIALNLKLVAYDTVPVHLLRDGGEQHKPEFHALNPQELIPLLVDGDYALGQSLAIFHYLESQVPQPALVPDSPCEAARMWAFCQAIASEIQPLQNTRVLRYLTEQLGLSAEARSAWLRHWIGNGLDALEEEQARREPALYCFGPTPTYADCCLVPQMYAAERFGAERDWPRLRAILARCREHEAFIKAHPDAQVDAQKN
jgi:maleylacetoacetate isomerase